MGIEEIRRQKADALLEFQESESHVIAAVDRLRRIAGTFDEFVRLLRPDDIPGKNGPTWFKSPNIAALQHEKFRVEMSYDTAMGAAEDLRLALSQLNEASAKKIELGLR